RMLVDRREAVLFAHFGLTGPAILDVSRAVAREDRPDRLVLTLDFVPAERPEVLDSWLQEVCRAGRPAVAGGAGAPPPRVLARRLPRRLGDSLLSALSIPTDRVGPELTRDERRRLVGGLKALRLPIVGTLGFGKAEVTSGGVVLEEVEPKNLESRLAPGLH